MENGKHVHTCTYVNEAHWWPSNAITFHPFKNENIMSYTPCSIFLRKREIKEMQIPFDQMTFKDQVLAAKFFISDNVNLMEKILLYQPFIPTQTTTSRPLEMIAIHKNYPGHMLMFHLTQLLKKPIAFTKRDECQKDEPESWPIPPPPEHQEPTSPPSIAPRTPTPSTSASARASTKTNSDEGTYYKALHCQNCNGYDWAQCRYAINHCWHPDFCNFCLKRARTISKMHSCPTHKESTCEDAKCPICDYLCMTCVESPVEGNFISSLIHNCGICKEQFLRYENIIEFICEKCKVNHGL